MGLSHPRQSRLVVARVSYRLGEGSSERFLAQQLWVEALEARVVSNSQFKVS
jgi:hypothetical protein